MDIQESKAYYDFAKQASRFFSTLFVNYYMNLN